MNPRLTLAHKLSRISRPTRQGERAIVRFLDEARRHGNDPELFAGLVHAVPLLRPLRQSLAAHAEARRLDPNIPTSYAQTILLAGDIDCLATLAPETARSAD